MLVLTSLDSMLLWIIMDSLWAVHLCCFFCLLWERKHFIAMILELLNAIPVTNDTKVIYCICTVVKLIVVGLDRLPWCQHICPIEYRSRNMHLYLGARHCFLLKTSVLVQTQTRIIWSYIIYTQMSNWWGLPFIETCCPVPDIGFDNLIDLYQMLEMIDSP